MPVRITSVEQIGQIARQVRKDYGIRQDDMAEAINASHVYLRDVENGKGTVQIGRLFHLLSELGIHVYLDAPPPPRRAS